MKAKRVYKKYCFNEKSGYMLNLLTLSISNSEVARNYE